MTSGELGHFGMTIHDNHSSFSSLFVGHEQEEVSSINLEQTVVHVLSVYLYLNIMQETIDRNVFVAS